MKGLLQIFFEIERKKSVAVTALLILASIAESFGIVNVLPALSLALNDGSMNSPTIDKLFSAVEAIGLKPEFETFLLLAVFGILLKTILKQIAMSYVGYTVAQLTTSFREQLTHALFTARWSYFTTIRPGKITNSLSAEVKRAGEAYMMTASLFAMQTQMLAYMIAGLFVSWQAMLIAALGAGMIGFLLGFLIRASRSYGRMETNMMSDYISYLSDTFINIRPIKAMNKQDAMHKLLIGRLANVRRTYQRNAVVREGLTNLSEALQTVMICGGFYLAINVFEVSVAEIATIGLLIVQTMKYFSRALKQYQDIVNRQAGYENVKAMIAECESQAESNTGVSRQTLQDEIRITNAAYSYGNHQVLSDVNLTVKRGERVVLCGPSGSGKSTISDIILGFIEPEAGEITIDGKPLRELDMEKWRSEIGYVPQEPTLFNDTVYANVTLLDSSLSQEDAWRALDMAGARDFVEADPMGLDRAVGERGSQLSGGQRQRIAIARAVIGSPKLLILDEVTSALDPETERMIVEQIRSLDRSITIITITHREAILDIADKIYEVHAGRVQLMERETSRSRLHGA